MSRFWSLIFALVLVFTLIPAVVLAQGGDAQLYLPQVSTEVEVSTANIEVIPVPEVPCKVDGWFSRVYCFILSLMTVQTGSSPAIDPTPMPTPSPTPIVVTAESVGTFLEITDDCPESRNFQCAVTVEFDQITPSNCPHPVSVWMTFKDERIDPQAQALIDNVLWIKVFPRDDGDRYNYLLYEVSLDCHVD